MPGRHDYTRYTQTKDDPFTARVKAFKRDDASELEDSPENWSAEKVKAAAEMFQRQDQKQQNTVANREMADVFIAEHPEYIDSGVNGRLMTHELRRTFGEGAYTLAQYEQAYESLCNSNFLNLDEKIVREQQKEAARARAQAERARSVTPAEQDLYEIPLEDLRRLDAIENQKRMQRIAEEGGW